MMNFMIGSVGWLVVKGLKFIPVTFDFIDAIEQMTGEELPDPETKLVSPQSPFVQPLDP